MYRLSLYLLIALLLNESWSEVDCPTNPYPRVYGGDYGDVKFTVAALNQDGYFYVGGQTTDSTLNPSASASYPYPIALKIH